jgi:hypothetical protein
MPRSARLETAEPDGDPGLAGRAPDAQEMGKQHPHRKGASGSAKRKGQSSGRGLKRGQAARKSPVPVKATGNGPTDERVEAPADSDPAAPDAASEPTGASAPVESLDLLPHHADLIHASAISDDVARARGYRSVTKKSQLLELGFGKSQALVPALVVPVWGIAGEIVFYQARPDTPRVMGGKPVKYETQMKSRMALDVPPAVRGALGNPKVPLYITEGVRKADSAVTAGMACIALLGVWNWRGTNEWGGKTALPDWEHMALNGRIVYIVFDSDVMSKPSVHASLVRLKGFLESRGAEVWLIYLPAGPNGEKVGLDDYLALGHSPEDLLLLAKRTVSPIDGVEDTGIPYAVSPSGFVWIKHLEAGPVHIQLTNFVAHIVADITEDDGAEARHLFEIETRLNGRVARFTIQASQFCSMNWATENLGASAIIFPGSTLRDHSRTAVQLLSKEIQEKQIFTHQGWRRIGGHWAYLHAAGAIGPDGTIAEVQVRPPESLKLFALPDPPKGKAAVEAVLASLRFQEIAPARTTVPIYATIYRAPLGDCDFSDHVVGETGSGKTALCLLAQQHYGSGLDAQNVPASWLSTGNANEGIAFSAKDTVLLVDDFCPTGSCADIQRFHREADRLLRAQGNRTGRQRMRSDSSLRPPKPPRGIILSTGEDTPRGVSLRARLMILEHEPSDLDWGKTTLCQTDAASGLYAKAMAAYVQWLAPQMEVISRNLRGDIRVLRERATVSGGHKRTPAMVASLAYGLHKFLEFAVDIGALTVEERQHRWTTWWAALGEAAAAQPQHHNASDPTARFLELLRAAVASGHAHVANPDGGSPQPAQAWGWRTLDPDSRDQTLRPLADRIGWVDGKNLYLEPEAAYSVAQKMAREGGEGLVLSSKTLHKRLKDKGLLVSTDEKRNTLTVRRTLEESRRQVLHLEAGSLVPSGTAQTDQTPPPKPEARSESWSVPWAVSGDPSRKTAQQTDQEIQRQHVPSGPAGQFGQFIQDGERDGSKIEGDTFEVEEL